MRQMATSVKFHVTIHEEDDGSYWTEVNELPGCFASGFSVDEVLEATFDAMQLWLPNGIKLGEPTWRQVDDDKPARASRVTKSAKSADSPRPKRQKMQVCA